MRGNKQCRGQGQDQVALMGNTYLLGAERGTVSPDPCVHLYAAAGNVFESIGCLLECYYPVAGPQNKLPMATFLTESGNNVNISFYREASRIARACLSPMTEGFLPFLWTRRVKVLWGQVSGAPHHSTPLRRCCVWCDVEAACKGLFTKIFKGHSC